jgi:hypothetical protein
MPLPEDWQNPITAQSGEIQTGIDPMILLPSRRDLWRRRLEFQWWLIRKSIQRHTMIRVTKAGVIVDGHHAVRASAEEGVLVDALVVDSCAKPVGGSIVDLPVA